MPDRTGRGCRRRMSRLSDRAGSDRVVGGFVVVIRYVSPRALRHGLPRPALRLRGLRPSADVWAV